MNVKIYFFLVKYQNIGIIRGGTGFILEPGIRLKLVWNFGILRNMAQNSGIFNFLESGISLNELEYL